MGHGSVRWTRQHQSEHRTRRRACCRLHRRRGRDVETGPFRLFTTTLDPTDVTTTELAAGYAQRWEIETILNELKTHQRNSKMALRSHPHRPWSSKRSEVTCAATTPPDH